MVHFYRNVFSHVPTTKVRETSHMLKAIHAQESQEAAQEKAQMIIEDLRRQKLGNAAELIEAHINETLSYYSFPDSHWLKIRTNNPLERIIRKSAAAPAWSGHSMNMDPLYAAHYLTHGAVA